MRQRAERRCPSGQECVSDCRVGPCTRESAGNRSGPAGKTIGTAHRTGAFSEVAVRGLRTHPAGPPPLARFDKQHGKDHALTSVAPQLARAVYALRQRAPGCDRDKVWPGSREQRG